MHYTCRGLLILTLTLVVNDPQRFLKTCFKSNRDVQATFPKGVTVVDPNGVGGRNIVKPIRPHRHSRKATSPAEVSAVRVCALSQPAVPGCFDANVQTYVLGVAQTIHGARGASKLTNKQTAQRLCNRSLRNRQGGNGVASKVVGPI